MTISSKLPHLRPNIFSLMSGLATKHNAINLAQGFPDFPCSPQLVERLHYYAANHFNQYAPSHGITELREQISLYLERRDGQKYNPDTEITVTSGATEGLFCAIGALVNKADEVIILEPAYDTYESTIELFGGSVKRVQLAAPTFQVDWDVVKQAISSRTKAIILNSPHNPSGSLLSATDLQVLANLLADSSIMVISDEVYADMVFAPHKHISANAISTLRERSIVIGSFGKSFHITGWKIGFCAAPATLTEEIRKIHNLTTFSVHTPSQYALADIMQDPSHIASVAPLYEQKRAYFLDGLKETKWQFLPSQGSYFITADYSAFSNLSDLDFCHQLIYEHGIAAIPYSAFYHQAPTEQRLIRFCFAKQEQTLDIAIKALKKIPPLI